MKLLIYLPALNEEEKIGQVIEKLPSNLIGIDLIQCLVVDDGSSDNTAVNAKLAGAYVLSHGKNRGVGAAFQSAVKFALENDADILVGIDADGQFDANEIPLLINPILYNKVDMVIGNRFVNGKPINMTRLKFWGNQQLAKIISTVCEQKFIDVSCGFRAYNREVLFRMNTFANFTYTHETILSIVFQNLRVEEKEISVKYFSDRKSRVASSILQYAIQTSKIIMRVMLDYHPIKVFGTFGGIFMGIGTLFEVFLISHYIITGNFSPYKSTGFIGLGFILFGMLILLIALIADMLNRLRINQDKLLYEIKKMKYDR